MHIPPLLSPFCLAITLMRGRYSCILHSHFRCTSMYDNHALTTKWVAIIAYCLWNEYPRHPHVFYTTCCSLEMHVTTSSPPRWNTHVCLSMPSLRLGMCIGRLWVRFSKTKLIRCCSSMGLWQKHARLWFLYFPLSFLFCPHPPLRGSSMYYSNPSVSFFSPPSRHSWWCLGLEETAA